MADQDSPMELTSAFSLTNDRGFAFRLSAKADGQYHASFNFPNRKKGLTRTIEGPLFIKSEHQAGTDQGRFNLGPSLGGTVMMTVDPIGSGDPPPPPPPGSGSGKRSADHRCVLRVWNARGFALSLLASQGKSFALAFEMPEDAIDQQPLRALPGPFQIKYHNGSGPISGVFDFKGGLPRPGCMTVDPIAPSDPPPPPPPGDSEP